MDLKLCRLCAVNEGTSYIFGQDGDLQISAKIMYCCTRVVVIEGDGLPSYICTDCEKDLDLAYQIVLRCETTDQRLRFLQCRSSLYPVKEPQNNEPKIEVKLEEDNSDHENNFDDDRTTSEINSNNVQIKRSNRKRKLKVPKSKTSKNVKSSKCFVCCKICASPSALIIHMRNHTGETPFHCPNCEKKYKDPGSLKRHIDTHHFIGVRERKFICEHCGKGFYSKTDVKIHMRVHTGETPYHCSECSLKFTQLGALIRHKKRHSGEKTNICATCGKRFCTKEELKYHFNVHTDEKKFACTICNVPFKYKNNLKKHMLLHSAPNNYICNYCGRTFNLKGNLKSHINGQHSEKSGYCNICLKNVPDYEVHMWRHTGHRPLKCELCSSAFFELKALARHVNYRHKNTDKFQCSFEGCGMKFPARTMLEFHIAKIHDTGKVPFPCDQCTRGFYRKNDLARHKIGTHKVKLLE